MTEKKDNEIALPSEVIKEVATNNGWDELEYRKEKGTYLNGATYERQSWIGRRGTSQKEIITNYSESKTNEVEETITVDLTKGLKKE